MLAYLSAGAAYFLYVTLKALQQRQVMSAEYWRMPLVSYGMAFCEVFVIGSVAQAAVRGDGWAAMFAFAFSIGTGGALGSVVGTWLHARSHP